MEVILTPGAVIIPADKAKPVTQRQANWMRRRQVGFNIAAVGSTFLALTGVGLIPAGITATLLAAVGEHERQRANRYGGRIR
ncbi:MAG TPA: hypothetical protein VEW42_02135 [Candidatus Eisenbacteria bacterium]|nr:hypothetical protein [Candidatus Eisenbacteria bacterium]